MDIQESKLKDCFIINPRILKDTRGFFIKTFHSGIFEENGLDIDYKEEYYSYSKKNVLRGMHFQLPPAHHTKLVYCIEGQVFDAVIDLRKNSPTYKQNFTLELSSENAKILYIPKGMAHGFFVLSEQAIMVYNVTTVYNPSHDAGILWDSCGISWPCQNPIISERDLSFPAIDKFQNPF